MRTERREKADPKYHPPVRPAVVGQDLGELRQLATQCSALYGDVYGLCYRGQGGAGEKVRSVGADPTGESVAARRLIQNRHHAWQATEHLKNALAELRGAVGELEKVPLGTSQPSESYKGHHKITHPEYVATRTRALERLARKVEAELRSLAARRRPT